MQPKQRFSNAASRCNLNGEDVRDALSLFWNYSRQRYVLCEYKMLFLGGGGGGDKVFFKNAQFRPSDTGRRSLIFRARPELISHTR